MCDMCLIVSVVVNVCVYVSGVVCVCGECLSECVLCVWYFCVFVVCV